jgi:hypothetical protein
MITILAAALFASPQEPKPFQGEEVFQRLVANASAQMWRREGIGQIMGQVGEELLGTPYVGFTAERWVDHEVCSIDLTGLDCVTFYENCLAFARMIKKEKSTPQAMLAEVTFTRYRGGRIGDYTSRLHYTSDWIFDNDIKGVVENLTPRLPGAAPFTHRVGFMTANSEKYKQLARFPKLIPIIKAQEEDINSRQTYVIPADKVDGIEAQLQTGDILGFTTSKEGLDTSHTGMVLRKGEKVGVLHASLSKKAVVFEPDLSNFVQSFATGVMVCRPLEP